LRIHSEIRDAADHRMALSPILAHHRQRLEGLRGGAAAARSPFELVDSPRLADVCVLPYQWSHYLWHRRQAEAVDVARRAEAANRDIVVWFGGDLPPVIDIPNALVYRCSMYRSRGEPNAFAAPCFIDDPLGTHGGFPPLRPKPVKPLIGFCGYAALNPAKIAYGILLNARHNVRSRCGRSPYQPIPVLPATLLRARALALLARDPRVETRFLVRTRYRAGFRTPSRAGQNARQEFLANMLQTDYTLCVRGYGNWSIRFYETLACGRIPIFIDTDCVLPLEDDIDWRRYCVWVDRSELPRLAAKVAEFHAALSDDEFAELQVAARRLWVERLSQQGFMEDLAARLLRRGQIGRAAPAFAPAVRRAG
jgi:hypothetical protein